MRKKQRTTYSVVSGRRPVALMDAWTPAEAVIEYLRGLGCRHDEIQRTRVDAISWRGATYTATPVVDE